MLKFWGIVQVGKKPRPVFESPYSVSSDQNLNWDIFVAAVSEISRVLWPMQNGVPRRKFFWDFLYIITPRDIGYFANLRQMSGFAARESLIQDIGGGPTAKPSPYYR